MVIFYMKLDKKMNNKLSNLNPGSIKEINMNSINMFDTNLKFRRNNIDGFKMATKLKRNFK